MRDFSFRIFIQQRKGSWIRGMRKEQMNDFVRNRSDTSCTLILHYSGLKPISEFHKQRAESEWKMDLQMTQTATVLKHCTRRNFNGANLSKRIQLHCASNHCAVLCVASPCPSQAFLAHCGSFRPGWLELRIPCRMCRAFETPSGHDATWP